MLNNSNEIKVDVSSTNKIKSLTNDRNNNGKNSKSISNEQIVYMQKEESNGISLYTHIRALLDMIIFQNPAHPVKYFEYYSEELKKHYHKPQRDPDIDILNNIDKNVCDKILNAYKFSTTEESPQVLDDKISDLFYGEEFFGYEGEDEHEEEAQHVEVPTQTSVQDFSKTNYVLKKAGCGLTNDEVNLIAIVIEQMYRQRKFKNIRYWGKVLGLKRNYYVMECELHNEALEFKLRLLNMAKDKNDLQDSYENIYENEEVLPETYSNLSAGFDEQISSKENVVDSSKAISTAKVSSKNPKSVKSTHKSSEMNDSDRTSSGCDLTSIKTSDTSPEMYGFGTNKMIYFVTNKLCDEWIELPLLEPHHIVQSRNIKRYFTGDLDSRMESYPLFQGLEKHYLRAQIARITAATHISPRDYFVLDKKKNAAANLKKFRKLKSFQQRAMSHKWIHNYELNPNYEPLSTYDLQEPNNWVHHIPLISEKGVTKAWVKLREIENKDSKGVVNAEKSVTHDEFTEKTHALDFDSNKDFSTHKELFVNLSEDAYVDEVPPWKFEVTNPFDHRTAYVTVKSNLWPGAFAVTRQKFLDNTYYGWGHKWNADSLSAFQQNDMYPLEYLKDNNETTEMNDPTYEDELTFVYRLKKMKEMRKQLKNISIDEKRLNAQLLGDENEEEEKLLKQYDYD